MRWQPVNQDQKYKQGKIVYKGVDWAANGKTKNLSKLINVTIIDTTETHQSTKPHKDNTNH